VKDFLQTSEIYLDKLILSSADQAKDGKYPKDEWTTNTAIKSIAKYMKYLMRTDECQLGKCRNLFGKSTKNRAAQR